MIQAKTMRMIMLIMATFVGEQSNLSPRTDTIMTNSSTYRSEQNPSSDAVFDTTLYEAATLSIPPVA